MKTRYVVKVTKEEPETRWFRRNVLRRKYRSEIIHAGLVDSFQIERQINNLTNAVFVTADPMASLTWMEQGLV